MPANSTWREYLSSSPGFIQETIFTAAMRPNRLRTTVSTLVPARELYYKWQWYETCANCFPSRIEPFSFPKHKAGAFLQNRALSSLFAIVAIASSLSAGKLWARSQAEEAGGAQTQVHAPEEPDASCIGAAVDRISFPGVNDSDQKMLRDMLPVKEGKASRSRATAGEYAPSVCDRAIR